MTMHEVGVRGAWGTLLEVCGSAVSAEKVETRSAQIAMRVAVSAVQAVLDSVGTRIASIRRS